MVDPNFWAETLGYDIRQCCGCWKWFPLEELHQYPVIWGEGGAKERRSAWYLCQACQQSPELNIDAGSSPGWGEPDGN